MTHSGPPVLRIQHYPCSNFDERPPGIVIDTVVIHATVLSSVAEVIRHFCDPNSKVSSHYTIDRDGAIAAHVAEDMRAWHAGPSRMIDGRTGVNDFSIGIELVNRNDGEDPFPEPQIESMRALLKTIVARYPIQYIIPHYACADPPGRKSDPVGFEPAWVQGLR
jgi:N-acetyl-anhydromuramyl-L-alanine amidase AmpD